MGTSSHQRVYFCEFKYGCDKCGSLIEASCKRTLNMRERLHKKCCKFTGVRYDENHFKKLDEKIVSDVIKNIGATSKIFTH